MTNVQPAPEVAQLPARLPDLPGCGAAAAKRFEIYRSGHGRTFAKLAGAINVCPVDADAVAPALGDGFLIFPLNDDVSGRPCGSGVDFTGDRPEPLAARCRAAYPDYGRVHDIGQAHTEALAIETPTVAQLPHVERALADAAGQDAVVRIARAGILRAVSRERYAVDQAALPAPETVTVHGGNRVSLLFDAAAEVIAWAERHGNAGDVRETHQVDPEGRRWHFTEARIVWRGFNVTLAAVERTSAVAA
ncbi:hypothetical protein O7622_01065 [Micromonospora sp. WMMD1076]|uniref:hypothetical protein n=1 Tax=Micromonospora sp. WMMD1076 TaxID=3016103 RepID=UPI00249B842A|nr:hypothetical protein [Micromonospora sp. WMMD1076]WFF07220.1 hypothetical protein O7622_01065 [Micromonospora sp. WMMD1076]